MKWLSNEVIQGKMCARRLGRERMLLVIKYIHFSAPGIGAFIPHTRRQESLDNNSTSQHMKTTSAHFIWLLLVLTEAKGRDPEQREFLSREVASYYSAIKRNEIGSFIVMQMDLESVTEGEVSQKEKNKYCILMHVYGI